MAQNALSSRSSNAADPTTLTGNQNGAAQDQIKLRLSQGITTTIEKLEDFSAKISTSKIPTDSVNAITQHIDEMVRTLEAFNVEVQGITSLEEGQALMGEVKAYLSEAMGELKNLLDEAKLAWMGVGEEEISAAIDKIELTLKALKLSCNEEMESINQIEQNIAELEALLIELNTALQNKDLESATAALKSSQAMLKEVSAAVKILAQSCDMPNQSGR